MRTAYQEHCDHEFNSQYDSISERYAGELRDIQMWNESEMDFDYQCWREHIVENPHEADEPHREALRQLRDRVQLRKLMDQMEAPF